MTPAPQMTILDGPTGRQRNGTPRG
jgi:hypothetical protein